MKKPLIFLLWLSVPLFCMADPGLTRTYVYDAAGNRTLCKVLEVDAAPPAPTDPEEPELDETEYVVPEYYVEKVARVEIKIYPNPTTENVTLEIADWETLQTGIFKLYSLTGQLLQERPVHSATTTVSLANLPRGAYILKVNINNRIEDWKVIKN